MDRTDCCNFFIRSNSHHPDHIICHFSSQLKPLQECDYVFRNRQETRKHVLKFHRDSNINQQKIANPAVHIFPTTQVGINPHFFKRFSLLILKILDT